MQNKLQPWQTFSFFISSTFTDMDAERDYLRKIVFPRLNEYFAPRRVSLKIIDLRWGVNTNDFRDEQKAEERETQILKVCFDEIKRSRPFFIALLGDRYGWIPSDKQYNNILNKLSIADADLIRNSKGMSVTAMEILFGAIGNANLLERSLFFFRKADYTMLTPEQKKSFQDEAPEIKEKLSKLHAKIESVCEKEDFNGSIGHYEVKDWNGEKFTDIEAFGDMVYAQLIKEIEEELKDADQALPKDWYEQEEQVMSDFIFRHNENFVGRDESLKQLIDFACEKKTKVLTGFSGCGKSSVMCQLYNLLQSEGRVVLFHSAGVTQASMNVDKMLQRWSRQLCLILGMEYQEIKAETIEEQSVNLGQNEKKSFSDQVKDQFYSLAYDARMQGKDIVILMDALDRFPQSNTTQYLQFLPPEVSSIITSLPDVCKAQEWNKEIEITDMESFSREDALAMISRVCQDNHKDMHEQVIDALLTKERNGKYACESPLWLNLATTFLFTLDADDFREIRTRKEEDNEDKILQYQLEIVSQFPKDSGELFLLLLNRASEDFGNILTNKSFQYIALTRQGLRESDLSALIGEEWDELKFSNLRRWFRPLMVEQGEGKQWYFGHNKLVEALRDTLSYNAQKMHRDIANHFLALPDTDVLRTQEIMYHMMYGDMKKEAAEYYAKTKDEATAVTTNVIAQELRGHPTQTEISKWVSELLAINNSETLCHYLVQSVFKAISGCSYLHLQQHYLENLCQVLLKKTQTGKSIPNRIYSSYAECLSCLANVHSELEMFDEASNEYEEVLKIRRVLGQNTEEGAKDVATAINNLSSLYEELHKYEAAEAGYKEALKIRCELMKLDSSLYKDDYAQTLCDMADLHRKLDRYEESETEYEKAIEIRRQLAQDGDNYLLKKYALALNDLAIMYRDMEKFSLAEKEYEISLNISRELARKQPDLYTEDVAIVLNNLAICHKKQHLYKIAEQEYWEALGIRRMMASKNQDAYLIDVAITLNNLAILHNEANKQDDSEKEYQEVITIFRRLAAKNPDAHKARLAIAINNLASLYYMTKRFDNAEAEYKEALRIFSELAEDNPDAYNAPYSMFLNNVAVVHVDLGRYEDAEIEHLESLKIRRSLAENNPEVYNGVVAMSLNNLALLKMKMKNYEEASLLYSEALEIRKQLAENSPDAYNNDLVISLNDLAFCKLSMNQLTEALEYINEAIRIEPMLELFDSKGEILMRLNRFGEALSVYNRILEMEPTYFENNHTEFYKLLFNELRQ